MFTQFPGTAFQRTIYEADGTYPNGTAVDVEVTDTGVMVEYEEGIKMAKVPANVQAALKANFPTLAKISEIEWVMKPMVGNGGKLVNSIWYEFEGMMGKNSVSVYVSQDGSQALLDMTNTD
jgi:hypothetical protein